MENEVNIFIINNSVVEDLQLTLESMLLSKNKNSIYKVYLLDRFQSVEDREQVLRLSNNQFIIILIKSIDDCIKIINADKLIVLKSGIIVKRDLKELLKTQIGNLIAAAGYSLEYLLNNYSSSVFDSELVVLNVHRIKQFSLSIDEEDFLQDEFNSRFGGLIFPLSTISNRLMNEDLKRFNDRFKSSFSSSELESISYTINHNRYLEFFILNRISLLCLNNVNTTEIREIFNKNIVFNFDHNVIDQFIVASVSMLENTDSSVNIYCLINDSVTFEDKCKILYYLSLRNKDKFHIQFLQIDSLYKDIFSRELFEIRGITKVAYSRLFIPEIFKNLKGEVVYSDCDVLFEGDIFRRLSSIDLSNFRIYGVPSIRLYNRFNNPKYINSGFLVYNLNNFRKRGFPVTEVVHQLSKKLIFQDQDIINEVFKGDIGCLPCTFCVVPKAAAKGIYDSNTAKILFSSSEREEIKNPLIIHWSGVQKPWSTEFEALRKREWFETRDLIFSGQSLQSVVKEKIGKTFNLPSMINRQFIGQIIGKDHLIPKIATYIFGDLQVDALPDIFVMKSSDYLQNLVINKQKLDKLELIRKIENFCKINRPVLIEQYIKPKNFILVKFIDGKISIVSTSSIDINIVSLIQDLSIRLYNHIEKNYNLKYIISESNELYFSEISI